MPLRLREMCLQAGEIADRRVEPDVEVLARRVRESRMPKYGASREMSQSASALSPSPSSHSLRLVGDLGLQPAVSCVHAAQELDARRVRQPKKKCSDACSTGLRAGQRRVRVLQVGRRVDRAAVLAGVAVLVLRAALRALALDVAVGQEHALHRIVELLDRLACRSSPAAFERAVDVLRQLDVLRRVRRVPVCRS